MYRFRKPAPGNGLAGSIPASSAMFNSFKKKKKEPENFEDILEQFRKLEKSHSELVQELADFKEKNKKSLQKRGIIRFNPFGEVGGDQSFSIALLDANKDGFVITSHYARESNRVYAKPIKGGESEYKLSEEEKKVITEALNS